jgi:hypothetical protein
MSFVIRERKPLIAAITVGQEQFNLHLNSVSAEEMLILYQDHYQFLSESKNSTEDEVALPVDFMKDIKKLLLKAACGWDGILDEQGQAVPFELATLEQLVDSDINVYMQLMQAISQMFNETKYGNPEKN